MVVHLLRTRRLRSHARRIRALSTASAYFHRSPASKMLWLPRRNRALEPCLDRDLPALHTGHLQGCPAATSFDYTAADVYSPRDTVIANMHEIPLAAT
jgi:hypothetical protein